MGRYRVTPVVQLTYVLHFYEGEAYDSHGYVGQVRKVVRQWTGSQKFVGHFVRIEDGGATGGPSDVETNPTPPPSTPPGH